MVDLSLEDVGRLVTAEVCDGDAVVTAESVCAQRDFDATKEIIQSEGRREVLGDLAHAL